MSDICDWFLTVFEIEQWQFPNNFFSSNTFLRHFQIFDDIIMTDSCLWFLTYIWHNSYSFQTDFLELTVFWQIFDRYMTDQWKCWDQHWTWVPNVFVSFSVSPPGVVTISTPQHQGHTNGLMPHCFFCGVHYIYIERSSLYRGGNGSDWRFAFSRLPSSCRYWADRRRRENATFQSLPFASVYRVAHVAVN